VSITLGTSVLVVLFEYQVSIQDENPRSGLHLLYLAMRKASLLNDIFGNFGFSPRWKPTIFEWAIMKVAYCSLHGGFIFLEPLM
jgi:hypothetical protein